MYYVTKTYGHERGFSCAFRQWRAESHCRFIHGYALAFELTFQAYTLDHRNWVIDFGDLKHYEDVLRAKFDHKLVIAMDDPQKDLLMQLDVMQAVEVRLTEQVGCEAFAEYMFHLIRKDLRLAEKKPGFIQRGLDIVRVKVSEHGSNSASFGD